MSECVHLDEPSGRILTVRCRYVGGAYETARVHHCRHPERATIGRRGPRPGLCLPAWPGPWRLPEQATESSTIALCASCPLRAT